MHVLLAAISYDPIVHIPIGPLRISPHGVGIAVGFLIGARLMLPEAGRKGISEDAVYSILIRAAIGALIGARLAYVINHLGTYSKDPLSIFKVWEGGISLLGGIFGAIILALPVARKLKVDAWKGLDAAAPGMALGIVVGRVGDLIVGDHLGTATDLFLGYECPPVGVATASPCGSSSFPNVVGAVVHQTALYDMLLTCGLLALLLYLRRHKPSYDGFLIIVFGAWYGTGRIIEDFLREDVRRLGLTGSQWTALTTLTICLCWLAFVRRPPKWGHWGPSDDDADTAPPGADTGDEEAGAQVDGAADVAESDERPASAEPTPTMASQPQDREEH